jgi:hypothetical protein
MPAYGEPVAFEGHAVDAVDAALPRAGPVVSIARQWLRHREEVTLLENTAPILSHVEKFKYSYDYIYISVRLIRILRILRCCDSSGLHFQQIL